MTIIRLTGGAIQSILPEKKKDSLPVFIIYIPRPSSKECLLCPLNKPLPVLSLPFAFQNKLARLPVALFLFTIYFIYLWFSPYYATNGGKNSLILRTVKTDAYTIH